MIYEHKLYSANSRNDTILLNSYCNCKHNMLDHVHNSEKQTEINNVTERPKTDFLAVSFEVNGCLSDLYKEEKLRDFILASI